MQKSGGFGTFLILAHNTADWEATVRSYDLFARYDGRVQNTNAYVVLAGENTA